MSEAAEPSWVLSKRMSSCVYPRDSRSWRSGFRSKRLTSRVMRSSNGSPLIGGGIGSRSYELLEIDSIELIERFPRHRLFAIPMLLEHPDVGAEEGAELYEKLGKIGARIEALDERHEIIGHHRGLLVVPLLDEERERAQLALELEELVRDRELGAIERLDAGELGAREASAAVGRRRDRRRLRGGCGEAPALGGRLGERRGVPREPIREAPVPAHRVGEPLGAQPLRERIEAAE